MRVFVPGSGEDYEIQGVKVFRFPTRQLPSNILPLLFRRLNVRNFLQKARDVLGKASDRVEVCHGHTANCAIYPLAIKRIFPSCKTLLHHHDSASFGLNLGILHRTFFYNAWLFCRLRNLFERFDYHVFVSEICRRSFLSAPNADWTVYEDYKVQMRGPRFFHCKSVKTARSIIFHNGVDVRVFNLDFGNRMARRAEEAFVIGCIANFIDLKAQLDLLKAIDILIHKQNNAKITVKFVGSGLNLQGCKAYACEQGLTPYVEFLSECEHDKLSAFYRSLDLFVLPSYFEGFGCVFMEAWACGVPFITCEGQGMDDLIPKEDRCTWLCKPRNPGDLAKKIKYVLESRPVQKLTDEIDIDTLVARFLKEIALT